MRFIRADSRQRREKALGKLLSRQLTKEKLWVGAVKAGNPT